MFPEISYGTSLRRVVDYSSGSGATVESTSIDMSNFEGVRWVALLGGGSTATLSMKAQMCDTSTGTYVDVAGSAVAASTGTNIALSLDIYRPQKRYVRVALVKTSTEHVIHGVVSEQYAPRKFSDTTLDHSSVAAQKTLPSPSSGTA